MSQVNLFFNYLYKVVLLSLTLGLFLFASHAYASTVSAGSSTIEPASPTTITAGASQIFAITARDATGSLVDISTATISTTGNLLSNSSWTITATSTNIVTATYQSFQSGLEQNLAVIINSVTITVPTLTIFADTANATNSSATIIGSPVVANGTGVATITINLVDADNNPTDIGGSSLTLAISSGVASLSNFAQTSMGTYVIVATSTTAGQVVISVALDGTSITVNNATISFIANTASSNTSTATIANASVAVNASVNVNAVLRDANNNLTDIGSDTLAIVSPNSNVSSTTFTRVSAGIYSATLTSSQSGNISASVTLGGTAIGSSTILFNANTASSNTSTATIANASVAVNASVNVNAVLRDANNNLTDIGSDTLAIVSPNSNVSSTTFTRVSAGIYSATLTSSQSGNISASVTLGGTAIGSSTILFNANTASSNTSTATIANASVAVNASVNVNAVLRDANNNLTDIGSDTLAIVSPNSNVSSTTFTRVSAGIYSATLTSSQSGNISASVTLGGTAIGSSTILFNANTASSNTSTATIANASVAVNASVNVNAVLRDANNNLTDIGSDTLAIVSPNSNVSSTTFTRVSAGIYSATLTSSQSGNISASVTLGGTAIGSSTILFNANTASSNTSTATIANASVAVNASVNVNAVLRDANNNLTDIGSDTLAIVSPNSNVSSTTFTRVSAGIYSATLTSSQSGNISASVTLGGTAIGSSTILFNANTASSNTSTATIANASVAVNASVNVNAVLRDANNNLTDIGSDTLAIVSPNSNVSSTTFTRVSAGIYSATLTSSQSGNISASVTLGGTAIGSSTILFNANTASSNTSTATIANASVAVNASVNVNAVLRDANNNLTDIGSDTLAIVSPNSNVSSTTFTRVSAGIYSATLTSSQSGNISASVTLGGTAIGSSTILFNANTASSNTSTATIANASVAVNASVNVNAVLRDANNNLTDIGSDTLAIVSPNSNVSSTTFTRVSAGIYSATLTSSQSGNISASVTLGGTAIGSSTILFNANTASSNTSTATIANASVAVNASVNVNAVLRDANNNLTDIGSDTLAIVSPNSNVSSTTFTRVSAGIYSATLTSSQSGNISASVTLGGTAIGSSTILFNANGADNNNSSATIIGSPVFANGISSATIIVNLVDADNNPTNIGGSSLTLAISVGVANLSNFAQTSVGTYVAVATSTTEGTVVISVDLDGISITLTNSTITFRTGLNNTQVNLLVGDSFEFMTEGSNNIPSWVLTGIGTLSVTSGVNSTYLGSDVGEATIVITDGSLTVMAVVSVRATLSIDINTPIALLTGTTQTLVTTGGDGSYVYTSSNPTIISVDSNGVLTANGNNGNTVTITVSDDITYNGQNTSNTTTTALIYAITQLNTVNDTIYLDSLGINSTNTIIISSGGRDNNIYNSSNSSIVTVDVNGVLTAIRAGNATIQVRDGEFSNVSTFINIIVLTPLTFSDANNDAFSGDTVLTNGDDFSFRINSPTNTISVVVNGNGVGANQVIAEVDGLYTFQTPTTGAFAGIYTITVTDITSGLAQTYQVIVLPALTIDKAGLFEQGFGDDSMAVIMVSGLLDGSPTYLSISSPTLATLGSAVATATGYIATTTINASVDVSLITALTVSGTYGGFSSNLATVSILPVIAYTARLIDGNNSNVNVGGVSVRNADGSISTTTGSNGIFTLNLPSSSDSSYHRINLSREGVNVSINDGAGGAGQEANRHYANTNNNTFNFSPPVLTRQLVITTSGTSNYRLVVVNAEGMVVESINQTSPVATLTLAAVSGYQVYVDASGFFRATNRSIDLSSVNQTIALTLVSQPVIVYRVVRQQARLLINGYIDTTPVSLNGYTVSASQTNNNGLAITGSDTTITITLATPTGNNELSIAQDAQILLASNTGTTVFVYNWVGEVLDSTTSISADNKLGGNVEVGSSDNFLVTFNQTKVGDINFDSSDVVRALTIDTSNITIDASNVVFGGNSITSLFVSLTPVALTSTEDSRATGTDNTFFQLDVDALLSDNSVVSANKAFDTTSNTDNRIRITMDYNTSVISEADWLNGTYVIYHANTINDLQNNNLIETIAITDRNAIDLVNGRISFEISSLSGITIGIGDSNFDGKITFGQAGGIGGGGCSLNNSKNQGVDLMFYLLLILALLGLLRTKMIKLLLMIGVLITPNLQAFDAYFGADIGVSRLEPTIMSNTLVKEGDSDIAFKFYLGKYFYKKFAIEFAYANLGQATIKNNTIDIKAGYQQFSFGGLYNLPNLGILEPFIGLGVRHTNIDIESNIANTTIDSSSINNYYTLGTYIPLEGKEWSIRLSHTEYSDDVSLSAFGFILPFSF